MSNRFAYPLRFGANWDGRQTSFRVWAPSAADVVLHAAGRAIPMARQFGDWFAVSTNDGPGTTYQFGMDGLMVPDPASRSQVDGVHGPSVVVDPNAYVWKNHRWLGRPWHEAVIYELNVGIMGGYAGVEAQLPRLASLGVTMVELMPLSSFPGRHNWGYDGVLPYAPDSAYGSPNELKSLIDTAHGLGLMVMLDVVYNHFGPDGAYLHAFAKTFFRDDLSTPWGAAIDFRRSAVRDYFVSNALYWLTEYQFDGLRFDAVHACQDPVFLDEMVAMLRHETMGRQIHLVMEHEDNAAQHLRSAPRYEGFDAQWTDDVHHCLHRLLTGESEGYYEDYDNPIEHLARCMREGFAFQGERSRHAGRPRGQPSTHLAITSFVICLQNHDQIGNRALGERLTTLANPDALRAAYALLLLSPFIPLLFMGEEFGSQTPFLFFTDHNEDLAELVRTGRREEFKHFAAFKDPARREAIPDPNDPATFEASKPDFAIAEERSGPIRDLLTLRRTRIVAGIPNAFSVGTDILSEAAMVARWRLGTGETLAIAINFEASPVAMERGAGTLLHETLPDGWRAVSDGNLPGRCAVAWLHAVP